VRRSSSLVLALTLVATLALPASAAKGPDYVFDPDNPLSRGPVSAIESEGVDTVVGEIAGAGYVGQRPDDWNGELVVWAHGYRGEGERLYVDPPPAREWLLDQGYAWIASSYRRNSYDPGVGVLDTKNVTHRAAQLWGQPDRTYLAGASMGGHVTAAAIEQFPDLYDGALPACGVLGDVELFDYFLDYNLGAAAFAGLDADSLTYPDADWVDDEVVAIKQALSLYDEAGAPITAWAFDGSPLVGATTDLLVGPGESFKDFVEIGSGGERGLIFDVAWDYWHVAGDGDFFFDLGEGDGTIANRAGIVGQNRDTDYASEYGPEFASLDDEILRVEGANRVRKSQGTKPAPIIAGDPGVPVLTIHTIGDLFVPIEMEQIYARRVAANSASDLLVQRAIRDVGHCSFSPAEWQQSFADLFDWVETGVRPAGDDLIGDISDPALGCEWTTTAPGQSRFPFPGC
jgi:pimeloyl-ACP methyl ester carboxylesterase